MTTTVKFATKSNNYYGISIGEMLMDKNGDMKKFSPCTALFMSPVEADQYIFYLKEEKRKIGYSIRKVWYDNNFKTWKVH